MADNQTTIILNAEDKTGPAFKSAANNARDWDKILRTVQQRQGGTAPTEKEFRQRSDWMRQGIQQTKQMATETTKLASAVKAHGKEATDSQNDQAQAVEKSIRAHKEQNRLFAEGSEELASMAARYGSVAFAVEKVREGFLNFANDQERLRVVGARIGTTSEQMKELEHTIEQVGDKFGQSVTEVTKTTEAFRNAAYWPKEMLGDVLKIAPAITEVARRFGVSSEEMAASLGSFVKQLKIAPADWEKSLGAISAAANDMNLDFAELNRFAPQITESMADMGEKGTEGLNKVLALLGMTRERFGSTTRAARALTTYLSEMQSGGGVSAALNMDSEEWSQKMQDIVAKGENVFDFYTAKIRESLKLGYTWGALFQDPNQRSFWKNIIENSSKFADIQKRLATESAEYHSGNTKDLENLSLQLEKLTHQWEEMWKAASSLAISAGLPALMDELTNSMKTMRENLEGIKTMLDNASWKNFFGGIPEFLNRKIILPSSSDVLHGMMNGPGGSGATPEHRAGGGGVGAGRSYMVGEHGPELFTPQSSGGISSTYTLGKVERNTEDSTALLSQIRDMMLKQEQDRMGDSGGGGGASLGGGTTTSSGGGGTSKLGGMASEGIPGVGGSGIGGGGTTPQSLGGSAGAGVEPQAAGASGGPGGGASGPLAAQRQRFAQELASNPALRDKVMRIAANEQGKNPQGTQAVIESMMNRASMRGTTLEKAARWFKSEPGGYYEMGNMGRGSLENPRHRAVLEQSLNNALGGSNISNLATDNSSGDLARRERATGKFRYRQDFNGETFFAPGSAEPGLAKKWDAWQGGVMEAGKGGLNQPALTQMPNMPTAPPAELDADKIRGMRSELAQPIRIRAEMDPGSDSQFRRASIQRQVNREVRESSWDSMNDIGAA
jgi:hypothetical protein